MTRLSILSRVTAAFVALSGLCWAAQAQNPTSSEMAQDAVPMPGTAENQGHSAHMVPELPEGLEFGHPMLLIAGPAAKSAAAFLVIENTSEHDDRLIAVEADFARSAQLHTHIMENDIAKMRAVEEGFAVPAGGKHELVRGGDHIMLTGLSSVPAVGDTVNMTLTFERAGRVTVPFPVMLIGQAGAMPHGHK